MDDVSRFRFGRFELDPALFKLLRDGSPVPLEPKALDLLRLLLERAPRVVEKSDIFSIVWKDVAVTDNALTRLVTQLRKALDDDPRAPRFIETVATRGYRIVAEVTRVERAEPGSPASGSSPSSGAVAATRRRYSWRTRVSVAAAAVILFAAAWASSGVGRMSPAREAWLTAAGIPDVVTLAALRPEQLTTGQGYDGFLAFAPDGKSVAFSSDRSGALEIYVQSLAPGSTPTALTSNGRQNVQPAWSPDGQFLAYHEMAGNGVWIAPSRGGVARRISDFGAHPAWSPDGRRVAFQSLQATPIDGAGVPGALSTIWMCEVTDGARPVRLTEPGDPAGPHVTPAWLPDSRHVMVAATSSLSSGGMTSLWKIDVETGERQQVVAHARLSPEYILAPDGRAVYFIARKAGGIWWLPLDEGDTRTGDPQPTGLPINSSRVTQLAVSADGKHIGWTGLESATHVWASAGAGQPGSIVQGLGVRYGLPAPASDGRVAMVGSRSGASGNLFLIGPSGLLRQLTDDPSNHGGPQWMPGEREIAFVTDQGEGPGISAIDPEAGRTRPLFALADLPRPPGPSQPSTASPAVNIVFAPDFTRLVTAFVQDGRPNLWIAGLRHQRPDGTLTQRTFEREGGSYPVWSPDGRWIAYQCNEGADTHVCVTSADDGERVQLTHEPGQSWVGGWKPDSDAVLFAAQRHAVWNVATVSRTTSRVQMVTHFTTPRGYVRYPRWDASQNRALFERSETTGRIWWVRLP